MTCEIGTDVTRAAQLLRAGKLVAFPTETVYGLGANAFDTTAVAAVFAAKGRPHFDPLIVHVTSLDAARQLTTCFGEVAGVLAKAFWPGPLTLVLPKAETVPDLVTAGLPDVAVRVPSHPLAHAVIEQAGVPVAAPSANLFGQVSPTSANHVAAQLGDVIDYLLDGGDCSIGVESTVLHVQDERITLLRPGGLTQEAIETVIGACEISAPTPRPGDAPQPSPGLLDRHYAPRTPLQVITPDLLTGEFSADRLGLLTLGPVSQQERFRQVEVLSRTGDLTEAAAHFYAALRRLDAGRVERIVALPFPDEGLGRALNDRLLRASIDA